MHDFTRRRLLGGMLIGAAAATLAGPASANIPADSYVPAAPPPPRGEAIPVLSATRAKVERWQPGYWRWTGHEHTWIDGQHVARPGPRAEWISGRWVQRPRGWAYIEGHWN